VCTAYHQEAFKPQICQENMVCYVGRTAVETCFMCVLECAVLFLAASSSVCLAIIPILLLHSQHASLLKIVPLVSVLECGAGSGGVVCFDD
jgi:hypothetical protein